MGAAGQHGIICGVFSVCAFTGHGRWAGTVQQPHAAAGMCGSHIRTPAALALGALNATRPPGRSHECQLASAVGTSVKNGSAEEHRMASKLSGSNAQSSASPATNLVLCSPAACALSFA